MKIRYRYKDKTFEDIRDIIQNNQLVPNYQYILNEYLPFQLFMTGKTFFQGVYIKIDTGSEFMAYDKFGYKYFEDAIKNYFLKHGLDTGTCALALSGGVDSSVLAFHVKPSLVYSGYYNDKDCNELPYSKAVAEKIEASHETIELEESDFIKNFEDCMRAIGTPIAGMGSVMEFALLKHMKSKYPNLESIIYGNGGDEVFLGYWVNHYAMQLSKMADEMPKYISNFYPSRQATGNKLVDVFLAMSLIRSPDTGPVISSHLFGKLVASLTGKKSTMNKIMFFNLQCILPSLLHLVNQTCRANGLKALNPLANNDFIHNAVNINTPYSEIPKRILREDFLPSTPEAITGADHRIEMLKKNYIKKGFPMPFQDWHYLDSVMRIACGSFWRRPAFKGYAGNFEYTGINRFAWGIFQAETWFRTFMD